MQETLSLDILEKFILSIARAALPTVSQSEGMHVAETRKAKHVTTKEVIPSASAGITPSNPQPQALTAAATVSMNPPKSAVSIHLNDSSSGSRSPNALASCFHARRRFLRGSRSVILHFGSTFCALQPNMVRRAVRKR
jgi:hypothetical protein